MNAKVVPIWFKWREIIFLIFSRSYAVKQYSAGYLIEVEVSKLVPNICFVKFRMKAKVVPIWFKWREITFLIFSRSYAVKQYSAGYLIEVEVSKLVANTCFVKFQMNAKAVPIWFKRREMTFFSRSYAVKQYAAGYLIEVEVSELVS